MYRTLSKREWRNLMKTRKNQTERDRGGCCRRTRSIEWQWWERRELGKWKHAIVEQFNWNKWTTEISHWCYHASASATVGWWGSGMRVPRPYCFAEVCKLLFIRWYNWYRRGAYMVLPRVLLVLRPRGLQSLGCIEHYYKSLAGFF